MAMALSARIPKPLALALARTCGPKLPACQVQELNGKRISRIHAFYRKFSLGLKLATQALALDNGQAAIWLQLGRCQLALGLGAAANDSFAQAREIDPQCPEADEADASLREAGFWARLAGRCRRFWEG